MTEPISCQYAKRFQKMATKSANTKQLYDLQDDPALESVYQRLVNTQQALADYKKAGCERDMAKISDSKKSDDDVDYDTGNLFGFNSSRTKRSKRSKRSRTKHSRAKRSKISKGSRTKRTKRSRSKRSKRSRSKKSRQKRTIKDVLNRKILLSETPAAIKKKLSVTLKKNKYAGTGLFATKPIRRGKTIAYYKMKVHEDSNKRSYKSPTKCMYCFTIYTKNDKISNTLMGDLDKDSAPQPKNNIPYWAYFSNEPSGKQKENAEIDIALKENYRNRKRLKPGDFITYKLKATRNIKAGEEVVWCYGEAYDRNYKTSCN